VKKTAPKDGPDHCFSPELLVDLSEADSRKWSPLLTPVDSSVLQPTEGVTSPRPRIQVQRHLNHEEQLKVAEAYEAGATMKAVARQFRIHRTTVRAVLDRQGATIRAHAR
jgi:DNA-binding NarL/FixJ family response regulator